MAVSTKYTYLMYWNESATGSTASPYKWEKLVDITTTPDIGSTPNMLETTTLSNDSQTFIPGIIQLSDGLEFGHNYTKSDYEKINKMVNTEYHFAIWKGGDKSGNTSTPNGNDGIWEFDGQIVAVVNGGGVDEVVGMTSTIAPSTTISFVSSPTSSPTFLGGVSSGSTATDGDSDTGS